MRRPTAPTTFLGVLLAVACVPDTGGDSGTESPKSSPAAERGGPTQDGAPVLEVGGVTTEAVENDTIELSTTEPSDDAKGEGGGEGGGEHAGGKARLRITFDSAKRVDSGVRFSGEAEYLHDKGAWVMHSRDFTALVPKRAKPKNQKDFEDGFDTYTAAKPAELATLTPDHPKRDFSVTIAGVPAEGDRKPDGTTGRYIQYETPGTLWGHKVKEPQDWVPGRLCYAEGEKWHDVPLFHFTDLPCS